MEDNYLYFSEREQGLPPQDREKIDKTFWDGFVSFIRSKINDGSFAKEFPINCPDEPVPIGSDEIALARVFQAEIPSMKWLFDLHETPETIDILDAIEFFYKYIFKPIKKTDHDYFKHQHILSFDQTAGRQEYLTTINNLFRRNSLAYELLETGKVRRLSLPVLDETLRRAIFNTGDSELDRLLELAREKFFSPDINVRREAVEKLWDAWERLKTLERPNKKKGVEILLAKAIPEKEFRDRINDEANALTRIGNDFAIRHTETDKIIISGSEYLDYLFHRLFSLIWLLLRRTRRVYERKE